MDEAVERKRRQNWKSGGFRQKTPPLRITPKIGIVSCLHMYSCNNCRKVRWWCEGLRYSQKPSATWFKISFSTSNISPISAAGFEKPCSLSLSSRGICGISEMSIVVGLLTQCGVAAVAGVGMLWCDLYEIERRSREGSCGVNGGHRTVMKAS